MRLLAAAATAGLLSLNTAQSQDQEAFIGSEVCGSCHATEMRDWNGSHHDLAMALPTEETVLGDFDHATFNKQGVSTRFFRKGGTFYVRTDGPDGELADFQVRYTFGWYPLQQYLLALPGGRLQALSIAWDSRPESEGGQRWFHLYPDEQLDHHHPLHWTGKEQNWNYQCAECHSTDLRKGYDPQTQQYQTTYAEMDVACEACHGPGAAHLAWAQVPAEQRAKDSSKGFAVNLGRSDAAWVIDSESEQPRLSESRDNQREIAICARCHSRRGQIREGSAHGESLLQTHRLGLLSRDLYFPDGQVKDEVYVHGSFIQSKMFHQGVSCGDCHDPHSLQLRREGNALCTGCHVSERYDDAEHHRHPTGSSGAQCIACHMPERAYMLIDWRADHSFRVPRPDLSVTLGTPNACNLCHQEQSASWASETLLRWYPESQHRGSHFGEAFHEADTQASGAAEKLLVVASDPAEPAIVRASAVARLQSFARTDQLQVIQSLLKDESPMVRAAATAYLDAMDWQTAVTLGWQMLQDPVYLVRIEAARVLAPLSVQELSDEARRQLNAGLEDYRESLLATAERAESWFNLGLLARDTGEAAEAESHYRQAISIDPGFVPAYVNLADLYPAFKRDEGVEKLLRAGMSIVPEDPEIPYALGLLLVRENRLSEALPVFELAWKLAPDNPRLTQAFVLALQEMGMMEKADQMILEQK